MKTSFLWKDSDWNWKTRANISQSGFLESGQWQTSGTMFENVPLPLDWPVYVSHAEASAYARRGQERNCQLKRSGIAPLARPGRA